MNALESKNIEGTYQHVHTNSLGKTKACEEYFWLFSYDQIRPNSHCIPLLYLYLLKLMSPHDIYMLALTIKMRRVLFALILSSNAWSTPGTRLMSLEYLLI